MTSSNKKPSVFFKRKSPSPQKSPSRTQKQSQKESRQRLTSRTHLPRHTVPPYVLKGDNEDDGPQALDEFLFYSREEYLPDSRASRPVSSVGENEWLNLSGVSHSSTRTQSAASDWNPAGETTSNSPPTATDYEEKNKEPASGCDKENVEEESTSQTQGEVTPPHNSLKSTTSTFEKKAPSEIFHETRTDYSHNEELTQLAFDERTEKTAAKTETKRLWKLDRSLVLSSEFPVSLAENKPEVKRTAKRAPDLLRDSSLPPLVKDKLNKDGFQRSSSLPSASSLDTTDLLSTTCNQASQSSGRSCQIRLPESFPGVCIFPPQQENVQTDDVSDEELGSLVHKRAQTPSAPLGRSRGRERSSRVDRLRVPRTAHPPPSSTRSSPGPQNYNTDDEPMAIRWASSEFLAARVVSEMDTAFMHTESQDSEHNRRSDSCVTPNLMARSNSLAIPRVTTALCSNETPSVGAFSSVHRAGYSNSMPNLPTSSARSTRRVFVTFDSDFPRASAVNLQGKSEVAARCRTLNRKMDKPVRKSPDKTNPALKLAQTNPVQKTVMIRKWVESCSPQGVKKRATKFPVYTK